MMSSKRVRFTAPAKPENAAIRSDEIPALQAIGNRGGLRVLETAHTVAVRYHCTRQYPWDPRKIRTPFVIHEDAELDSPAAPGSVLFRCPHCGIRFQMIAL